MAWIKECVSKSLYRDGGSGDEGRGMGARGLSEQEQMRPGEKILKTEQVSDGWAPPQKDGEGKVGGRVLGAWSGWIEVVTGI